MDKGNILWKVLLFAIFSGSLLVRETDRRLRAVRPPPITHPLSKFRRIREISRSDEGLCVVYPKWRLYLGVCCKVRKIMKLDIAFPECGEVLVVRSLIGIELPAERHYVRDKGHKS